VETKYYLMRDIGVFNYFVNEDIKQFFDPNYILNPHLSIKKPDTWGIKAIRRSNKIKNWFITKLHLH
jgi:hypothetical protein